eukprot:354482-Chlamydomonas_euryale.AAC.3
MNRELPHATACRRQQEQRGKPARRCGAQVGTRHKGHCKAGKVCRRSGAQMGPRHRGHRKGRARGEWEGEGESARETRDQGLPPCFQREGELSRRCSKANARANQLALHRLAHTQYVPDFATPLTLCIASERCP